MALFAIVLIGLMSLALLWKLGRLSKGAVAVAGAGLALGLVGYALQGSPAQPGAPVPPKADAPDTGADQMAARHDLIGKVGGEADILAQADAYFRIDRPDLAAQVIRLGLAKSPDSPGLWTGLGNAMVGHGKGVLSPAAEYCYRRALRLAPDYAGARYFYALALAQNGRVEEAKPIFVALVRQLPADAPMRPKLVADLVQAGLMTEKEAQPAPSAK